MNLFDSWFIVFKEPLNKNEWKIIVTIEKICIFWSSLDNEIIEWHLFSSNDWNNESREKSFSSRRDELRRNNVRFYLSEHISGISNKLTPSSSQIKTKNLTFRSHRFLEQNRQTDWFHAEKNVSLEIFTGRFSPFLPQNSHLQIFLLFFFRFRSNFDRIETHRSTVFIERFIDKIPLTGKFTHSLTEIRFTIVNDE